MKTILAIGYYHHNQTIILTGENMEEKGRWIICIEIAKEFPFSVDEVHDVYEIVRKEITKEKIVVTLAEQISKTKIILNASNAFGIAPYLLTNFIFGDK